MGTPLVINLCIIQPAGYVHALGFLDQARYFRHQFRKLGAQVFISKNRLRHDSLNFVFGAHLGFDADWRKRYSCFFVNLEQLGAGGAALSPSYLQLLTTSAVVDYDSDNVATYAKEPALVPIVPFLYAPYLDKPPLLALADRPIDVLFIGSMNARRQQMIERIESQGVQVTRFDAALYGPERDQFIQSAKCVFNAHFYPSNRFEQTRVAHCLSLGTPVVSERTGLSKPHAAFESCVHWVAEDALGSFFSKEFGQPEFFVKSHAALENFKSSDATDDYAQLLNAALVYHQAYLESQRPNVWRPRQINLGSGKAYKPGWLNIDVLERTLPDLLLDLGQSVSWPIQAHTAYAGPLELDRRSVELIYANNVLEHVPDLPMLMGNCLDLLQTGGGFLIEVPYEHSATAWQDPTHLRALNENSWLYYTDWFWYLGWFEHRFKLDSLTYLSEALQPCDKSQAAFMRVLLIKTLTSPQERNLARVMRPDFAMLDGMNDEMDGVAGD